jgi:hypothetical protein
MKPYSFEAGELHASVAEKLQGTRQFNYKGQTYEYGVLDPSVAPIHYAVGMYGGQNLIASAEIPEGPILNLYLGHEVECNRLRADTRGRCAAIETDLLTEVPADLLSLLVQHRHWTFEDLLRLYKIDPELPESDFYAEIAGTALTLRRRMKELSLQPLQPAN